MLFLVGLGLGDEKDITVKGLEAVQSCKRVYLDAYTSIVIGCRNEATGAPETAPLESFYGIAPGTIVLADRELVEQKADQILAGATEANIAFLVVGDPFGATTHTDLFLRAIKQNIPVKVIHNTSIVNGVGACGLQLYSFGAIVTIPFFTDRWRPDSFYAKIESNQTLKLHTLCLLDIRVKEQSEQDLLAGRRVYEQPRFMTVRQAAAQLLEVEAKLKRNVCGPDSPAVAIARLGADSQRIVFGTLGEFVDAYDELFGAPLHSLVLPGPEIHELEMEMLQLNILPGSKLSKN